MSLVISPLRLIIPLPSVGLLSSILSCCRTIRTRSIVACRSLYNNALDHRNPSFLTTLHRVQWYRYHLTESSRIAEQQSQKPHNRLCWLLLASCIRRRKPITFISNLLANSDIKLKRVQEVRETRLLNV